MSFRSHALAGLMLIVTATPAAAELPVPKVERGTAGLIPFSFHVVNEGSAPIACAAAIAHWYSADLGRADPGGTITQTLWFDPVRGAALLMNSENARLPIESLWCGLDGRSWQTRHAIALPNRQGQAADAISLTCQTASERLTCRSSVPAPLLMNEPRP